MNKFDEKSFISEQLALMLRSGITLESGLAEITRNLHKNEYVRELELLNSDLARGIDFEKAVKTRNFDSFYKNLMIIGAKTNRLPETLETIAAYYQDCSLLKTQITSLLIYPAIVLTFALILSVFNSMLILPQARKIYDFWTHGALYDYNHWVMVANGLIPLLIFLCLVLLIFFYLNRRVLVWKISPFRDYKVANSAKLISLCLESGISLDKAFEMIGELEPSGIKKQLLKPSEEIKAGHSVADAMKQCLLLPEFFQYMVLHSSECLHEGFAATANWYLECANNRRTVLLHLIFPAAMTVIAVFIVLQLYASASSIVRLLYPLINSMS